MTSVKMFCATILLLSIWTTHAMEFFQKVDGKVKDLPALSEYEYKKLTAGEWYFPYVSFGNEGDSCASGHATARATKVYIDLLMFDSQNNRYMNVPEDFTYQPARPGVYTSDIGVTKHIVAANMDSWLYCVQTKETNGQTEVAVIFATRKPELTEEAEKAFKDTSDELAKKNLLPKIRKVSLENCPTISNIYYMGESE